MCVAVAKAVEDGYEGIVCASTGNTAASAAAYAARAGVTAIVMHPAGAIAAAKQAQARAVGARVLEVRGSFDEALRGCLELAERGVYMLVNSLNPHRIEGQKTAAFEIVEELGRAPDVLALPYGGGGNTVAYAKGFAEEGAATRLVSAQAAERAVTFASAIRIIEPAHAHEVDALIADRRVEIVTVDDGEITDAWLEIASSEGIFCEPSSPRASPGSAVSSSSPGSTVVCVLTGHGLKDAAAVDVLTESTTVRRGEHRRDPRRRRPAGGRPVSVLVRAPATTANLGPGFDCAAAALDLWNELEVTPAADGEPVVTLEGEGADELPRDAGHLALRAFALVAPVEGHTFRFVNRIPLERGLGSSAATIAAGLVAGLAVAGREATRRRGARAGAAARGPRRQPRGRRARRRLPDLAERRAATRARGAWRPTCRSLRSWSSPRRA